MEKGRDGGGNRGRERKKEKEGREGRKGREGKGRKGKERKGKERKGKERKGKERKGEGANRPYLQPVAELRRTHINMVKSKGILKARLRQPPYDN